MEVVLDEMDPEYEPPDEWFTPNRTGEKGYISCATRREWATRVNLGNIKLPPPTWWIEEQEAKGRKGASKYAIWNRSYAYGRRLSIWMMAPLDDFRRAKFLRPRDQFI